jgi:hypothetical protein
MASVWLRELKNKVGQFVKLLPGYFCANSKKIADKHLVGI